jgi:hypothetical protein
MLVSQHSLPPQHGLQHTPMHALDSACLRQHTRCLKQASKCIGHAGPCIGTMRCPITQLREPLLHIPPYTSRHHLHSSRQILLTKAGSLCLGTQASMTTGRSAPKSITRNTTKTHAHPASCIHALQPQPANTHRMAQQQHRGAGACHVL